MEYEAITKYERNQADLMYAAKQIDKYGSEWVWLRKRWRWAVAIPKSNTSALRVKKDVRSYKRIITKPTTKRCPARSSGSDLSFHIHNALTKKQTINPISIFILAP